MQVALDGSPAVGGIKEALLFPDCADLQPLAYVQGLAKAVEKAGGRIYENTRVMNTDKTYVRAAATQHPTKGPSAAALCCWRLLRAPRAEHSPLCRRFHHWVLGTV